MLFAQIASRRAKRDGVFNASEAPADVMETVSSLYSLADSADTIMYSYIAVAVVWCLAVVFLSSVSYHYGWPLYLALQWLTLSCACVYLETLSLRQKRAYASSEGLVLARNLMRQTIKATVAHKCTHYPKFESLGDFLDKLVLDDGADVVDICFGFAGLGLLFGGRMRDAVHMFRAGNTLASSFKNTVSLFHKWSGRVLYSTRATGFVAAGASRAGLGYSSARSWIPSAGMAFSEHIKRMFRANGIGDADIAAAESSETYEDSSSDVEFDHIFDEPEIQPAPEEQIPTWNGPRPATTRIGGNSHVMCACMLSPHSVLRTCCSASRITVGLPCSFGFMSCFLCSFRSAHLRGTTFCMHADP